MKDKWQHYWDLFAIFHLQASVSISEITIYEFTAIPNITYKNLNLFKKKIKIKIKIKIGKWGWSCPVPPCVNENLVSIVYLYLWNPVQV